MQKLTEEERRLRKKESAHKSYLKMKGKPAHRERSRKAARRWTDAHREQARIAQKERYYRLRPLLIEQAKDRYRLRGKYSRYGITKKNYDTMLVNQNNNCVITGKAHTKENPLVIDHIKGTKVVRGLLDNRINSAMGLFEHNPLWLRKAADYIEKHNQSK